MELAAPGISRGAAPENSWAVPETRSKREDFAYKMAEAMGATNIRTGLQPGESAAMPIPAPEITAPNGRSMKIEAQFQKAQQTPEEITSTIRSLTGGAGSPHIGLIGRRR
jgi:hypothetical protein